MLLNKSCSCCYYVLMKSNSGADWKVSPPLPHPLSLAISRAATQNYGVAPPPVRSHWPTTDRYLSLSLTRLARPAAVHDWLLVIHLDDVSGPEVTSELQVSYLQEELRCNTCHFRLHVTDR